MLMFFRLCDTRTFLESRPKLGKPLPGERLALGHSEDPDLYSAGIPACFLGRGRLEACATPVGPAGGRAARSATGPAIPDFVGQRACSRGISEREQARCPTKFPASGVPATPAAPETPQSLGKRNSSVKGSTKSPRQELPGTPCPHTDTPPPEVPDTEYGSRTHDSCSLGVFVTLNSYMQSPLKHPLRNIILAYG